MKYIHTRRLSLLRAQVIPSRGRRNGDRFVLKSDT